MNVRKGDQLIRNGSAATTRFTTVGFRIFATASIVYLSLLYVGFVRAPAAGTYHDDGIYLVTAKSLAEGYGYRILSLPDQPFQTKYPILFPWLISLIWRVYPSFPANLIWLKAVPLAAGGLWLYLSWRLLLHSGASRRESILIVLLTASSQYVAFLSSTILSETLFAALLAAALLVLARIDSGAEHHFDGLLAGILMGAAILTRVVAVAPGVAGFAYLLASRRRRAACQFVVGLLSLAGPWFIWVIFTSRLGSASPYYSASNYAAWNVVFGYGWSEKLTVLWMNILYIPIGLGRVWGMYPSSSAFLLLPFLSCLVLVGRGMWGARKKPIGWIVAAYFALILLWVWVPTRFLVPILPLIILLGLNGFGRFRPLAVTALFVVLVVALGHLWSLGIEVRRSGTMWPTPLLADEWQATVPLYSWIRTHTAPDAIVTGNLDPAYYLYTGRHSVPPFEIDPFRLYYRGGDKSPIGSTDDLCKRLVLSQAEYFVVTPAIGFPQMWYLHQRIAELIKKSPGVLSLAYGNIASGYVVYRVDQARLRF